MTIIPGMRNISWATVVFQMIHMQKHCHVGVLLTLLSLNSFLVAQPSIDLLFKVPRYSCPSLSIDGKYFAALYTEDDRTSIMTLNLESKEAGRTSLPE